MFQEATPSLASLLDAASSGTLPPAPPYEMGKALRKSLASTGHLVERFLTACDALKIKVQEERLPQLQPCFQGFDFTASPSLKGEGLFVSPLHLLGDTLKIQPLLLTAGQASQALNAWHRVQLDAPKSLLPLLEIPAQANALIWPALLHLRPLHSHWEQLLRHSHLETLLDRLPHAWMLDPAPLPPGAVIPKLELASWEELTPDRSFTIGNITSDGGSILLDPSVSAQQWNNSIHQALQSFGNHPQVLTEMAIGSEAILLGIYQHQHQRVDLIGGIALHQDQTAAWQLSRW